MKLPNERWSLQTSWHIDATNGNDENDGSTDGTPLKSHAEFARRVNRTTLTGKPTVVVIHTDLLEEIRLDVTLVGAGGGVDSQLVYVGIPTQVLRSGTLSAVDVINVGANTPSAVTDSSLTAWTTGGPSGSSLINQRIRLVGGTNDGAVAWLLKQDASFTNKARTSTFITSGGSAVTPAMGDQYVVEKLPSVEDVDLSIRGLRRNAVCTFESIEVDAAGPMFGVAFRGGGADTPYVVRFCEIRLDYLDAHASFVGCQFRASASPVTVVGDFQVNGGTFNGLTNALILTVREGAHVEFFNNVVIQDSGPALIVLGTVINFGACFFDCQNGGVFVRAGGVIRNRGDMWGAGNVNGAASAFLVVDSCGTFTRTVHPSISVGGSLVDVAGTLVGFTDVVFNTSFGAAYVTEST